MSAIFGFVEHSPHTASPGGLEAMAAALDLHGPDRRGIWTDGRASVGHLLSVITPEDRLEAQPLADPHGRHVLVVDGRIDNRPELARELGLPVGALATEPDSTFVLRAYERWGVDCASHLAGAFALAVWDPRERSLLLARSPMGERPLFFCRQPGVLAFATKPRGLFALPCIPRELDEEYLADFLCFASHDQGRTLFRGIERLEAGSCVLLSTEQTRRWVYWVWDPNRLLSFPRDEDYVERFSELFDRVVADCLRSVAPVGVLMSGGLDSTSVAVTAARLLEPHGGRLFTFTQVPRLGFEGPVPPGRSPDESELVKTVSRRYHNLEPQFVRSDGQFYLDSVDEFLRVADGPMTSASNWVWIRAIAQEASRQGVKVLLTGAHGNLTISYDGMGLFTALLRCGRWRQALREARALAPGHGIGAAARVLLRTGVPPLLPKPLWKIWARLLRWRRGTGEPLSWFDASRIHPEFAGRHRVRERAHTRDMTFQPPVDSRRGRLDAFRGSDLLSAETMGSLLPLFGIELRDPTGDQRLLEFCLSLPEEQYLRNGTTRWLLRRAMKESLPAEVLESRQRGLQAADWFERLVAARERVRRELDGLMESDLARRALDLPRIRLVVDRLMEAQELAAVDDFEYRTAFEFALMAGLFLARFEAIGPRQSAVQVDK